MLIIRHEQLKELQAYSLYGFEMRVIGHLRETFPEAVAGVSDERLLCQLRDHILLAARYGFGTERQIVAFIDSKYLLGDTFENDIQHGGLAQMLNDTVLVANEKMTILMAAACTRLKSNE